MSYVAFYRGLSANGGTTTRSKYREYGSHSVAVLKATAPRPQKVLISYNKELDNHTHYEFNFLGLIFSSQGFKNQDKSGGPAPRKNSELGLRWP